VQHGVGRDEQGPSEQQDEDARRAAGDRQQEGREHRDQAEGITRRGQEEERDDHGQEDGPPEQGGREDGDGDEAVVRAEAREVGARAVAGVGETPRD